MNLWRRSGFLSVRVWNQRWFSVQAKASVVGENPATYVELMRLIAEKQHQEAQRSQALSQPINPAPHSTETFNNNLRRLLKADQLRTAQQYFFRIRQQANSPVAPSSYGILLNAYANHNEPFLAEKLFRLLKKDFGLGNSDCYSALIRAYANINLADEAVAVFREMEKSQVEIRSKDIRNLVGAFAQSSRLDEVEYYFSLISDPQAEDYLILARAYASVRDQAKLHSILDKLDFRAPVNITYVNFLISELTAKNLQSGLISLINKIIGADLTLSWQAWKDLEDYTTDNRNLVDSDQGLADWQTLNKLHAQLKHDNPSLEQQFLILQAAIEQQYERELIEPPVKKKKISWKPDVKTDADDLWDDLIQDYLQQYVKAQREQEALAKESQQAIKDSLSAHAAPLTKEQKRQARKESQITNEPY